MVPEAGAQPGDLVAARLILHHNPQVLGQRVEVLGAGTSGRGRRGGGVGRARGGGGVMSRKNLISTRRVQGHSTKAFFYLP